MIACEIKGERPLPSLKYQPQTQPGPAFIETPGQLADGQAAVKMRVSESLPHGVQGIGHRSLMALGNVLTEPLRGLNRTAL
jgi:hypothetical protein